MSRENFVIKLSNKGKGDTIIPLYINPSHITSIGIQEGTTVVRTSDGKEFFVVETPDQIEKRGGQYGVFKFINN